MGAALGITCEENCPDMGWDLVQTQLMMFAGLWGLCLLAGWSTAAYAITADMDEFREKIEVLQGAIQSSRIYVGLCAGFAIFMCLSFAFRSFSKTVDGMCFIVEMLGCMFFMFNYTLSWMVNSLHGFGRITVFMCTWAFVDTLMFPSQLCLVVLKSDGKLGWFSFSFLAALHVLESWRWMLEIKRVNLQVMMWQVIDVSVNILVLIFFSAMMMMTLENLGDPPWLEGLNQDKWNTLSSIYFVFVTISTVGYGDLAPVTSLGRVFAIVTIFGGISSVVISMYKVLQVLNIHSSGGGHYTPRMASHHIVVSGNPTTAMILDFIAEVFHPDHAEDAEDLHVVFLLPRGSEGMHAVHREMRQRKNIHIAPRIHVFMGSVLERHDLQRVAPMQAHAFFVLPNTQCKDYMHEDTEDIIRMMAVLKVNPGIRMIILLMKAENQQLLQEAGGSHGTNITCLSIDQFKLELIGKSCQVPGFASLICNLFKTIADCEDEDYSNAGAWLPDYDKGTGNEIYEVELSATYAQRGAVFSEVVLDVIEQTDGAVYLIGLVEVSNLGGKRVIVNPGTWYPIKDTKTAGVLTSGIFIAADREAVQQCEGGVFLGRRDRPQEAVKAAAEAKAAPRKSKAVGKDGAKGANNESTALDLADAYQDPLEDLIRRDPNLTREMQTSAKKLIMLAKQQRKAAEPQRMPLKHLATGGHILFLCIGVADGEELRLGAEHFLKPLRGDPNSSFDIPLLVMSPVPPRDWHRVSEDSHVFYMRGTALSLFDLERANFRYASTIIICHVGSPRSYLSEAWMVDSDVVCCARLIESELGLTGPPVIAEIAVDQNHPFIPLPGLNTEGNKPAASGMRSSLAGLLGGRGSQHGGTEHTTMPEMCPMCGFHCHEGSLACLQCGALPGDEPDAKKGHKFFSKPKVHEIDEYYRQARYATGQLFVGNVVTSLVVNTFFNPSLWELVHQMIKAEVIMVNLPRDWEGKSYYEYFDKLLREDELMPVAIYRRAEAAGKKGAKNKGRPWSYVYTAPPAKETHMQRGDRVICFGSAFKIKEEDLDPVIEEHLAIEEQDGVYASEMTPDPEAGKMAKAKAKAKPKAKAGH